MAHNDYISYGGDMMLFVNSGSTKEAIAFSTSAKLSVSMKTREISSKDSVGYWTEKLHGKYDWNMSSDALMNFATSGTTNSVEDLYAYFIAGLPINVAFASKSGTTPSWTVNSSVKSFSGTALITSFDMNAPLDDSATYSITLEGTGPLSIA